MFRHLRTRLTVLYAGLFALALSLVFASVYWNISANAEREVRKELASSGAVFDRVWTLRSKQLEDGASLLAHDFGFRAAFATHDAATLGSAVDNLRDRLGADQAFVLGVDGEVAGAAPPRLASLGPGLAGALIEGDRQSGIFVLDGVAYQAVAAPILSPALAGWVVFAVRLDEREMNALEKLAAIPLSASVLRHDMGGWRSDGGAVSPMIGRYIDDVVARPGTAVAVEPQILGNGSQREITMAKALPALGPGARAVLVFTYPLARAMEPFKVLLVTLFLTAVAALGLLISGSAMLARSVTRPISALDHAARRLSDGEAALAPVEGRDELARLATTFNAMAAEIRAREQRITHLAHHDTDTDLPNRIALERDIEALKVVADEQLVILIALGVKRYAEVRGAVGARLASQMMREIGMRLSLSAEGWRTGLLSPGVFGVAYLAASLPDAKRIAQQVMAVAAGPVHLESETVDVHLTAGLAVEGIDVEKAPSVIERAGLALTQAIQVHRDIFVFDAAVYGDPAANLSLMSEMMRGVKSGDVTPYYQPKHDIRAGRIVGLEALARWNHPTRKMLPPDVFIPMAEETGAIRPLTEAILALTIADQRTLAEAGHDLAISVNISGRLLGDADFAEAALAQASGAVGKLCFEITETAVMDNPELALTILKRFSAAGIDISIDDYGTGLSSLSYLKQIAADELKIDKAFVMSMGKSRRDALLVRSTVDLAHGLGMKVTAEGVEDAVSLSLLAGMGCDIAQGYFIARPMALPALMTFLTPEARPSAGEDPAPKQGVGP